MTYEEIYKKYKELFIILVEKAGRETGNTSYLKVEELLEDEFIKTVEKNLLEHESPLRLVLSIFIVNIFMDIYGIHTVEEWNSIKSYDKLQEFYKLYLRIPTIQFCSKYGLETFNETGFNFKIISKNKN